MWPCRPNKESCLNSTLCVVYNHVNWTITSKQRAVFSLPWGPPGIKRLNRGRRTRVTRLMLDTCCANAINIRIRIWQQIPSNCYLPNFQTQQIFHNVLVWHRSTAHVPAEEEGAARLVGRRRVPLFTVAKMITRPNTPTFQTLRCITRFF